MNNLTLRTKFIGVIATVFVAATLLLLATLSGVTARIIDDFAYSVASKQALNDSNKILAVIDREVVLAQKMADDTILRKWFASADDPTLHHSALEQMESYRRLFRDKSYFAAIDSTHQYYVANKNEKTTMVVLNPENSADKWYFESLKNVDTFALNLDFNTAIRQTKVWVNAIMKDRDGTKIGIVGSGIDITDFLNKIVHTEEKGIDTILINNRGVIQAHKDHAIVERNAQERDAHKKITIFSLLNNAADAERLKVALHNLSSNTRNVVTFPVEINGKKSVAAVSAMREIGWFNIVLVDVSNILRFNDFLPIILVSVLTLLAVVVVIGFQMNRMVLSPLKLLTTASRQLSQGSYDCVLPVRHNDEIGTLTHSFNSMAATVRNHTEHLEENVRLRTTELTLANTQLEKSQQRITESLLYASVIQASILPAHDLFDRSFSQWFIIYKPCDIVGGDLYWMRESAGHILLAVIDCTGHGVPGAFMTMTVNSVLNQVVSTQGADNPSSILHEVNRVLQTTLNLRQKGESRVDAGLDMVLCSINPLQRTLKFAGAGLSLYVMTDGIIKEIKGDRQRIGYQSSTISFSYTNHLLNIEPGSSYFAVTDGFFDEGGGEHGYCFGNNRFSDMLHEYAHLPLKQQGEQFEQVITRWRGGRKQRDDVTMVGFSF